MRAPDCLETLLVCVAVCASGCTGSISMPEPNGSQGGVPGLPGGSGGGTSGSGGGDAMSTPLDCSSTLSLPPRVRLMSSREYASSVTSLTGISAGSSLSSRGDNRHALFSASTGQVHEALAFELNQKAESVAAAAAPGVVTRLACAGAVNAGCVRDAISSLGARAFRRPLASDEVDRLVALYAFGAEETKPVEAGFALVLEALMQSPSFLNLVQLGNSNGTLSSHEVAATLAVVLTESLPDQLLRDAADADQLKTTEQIRSQVERLLATDDAKAVVTSRLARWLEADDVPNLQKAGTTFDAPLKTAMTTELETWLHDAVWSGDGHLETLFTANRTTITRPLADWYQVPASSFDASPSLNIALPPERKGVLTMPAFLTSHAQFDNSSTVFRGLFINRYLLCRNVDAPPPGAVGTNPAPGVTPRNQREKAELRIANSPCKNCHSAFEPFGVLFENYDELGRHRTVESGLPVDASWTIAAPSELAGPTANVLELAPKLSSNPAVRACVARAFSGVVDARAPGVGSCAPVEIREAFENSDGSLPELMKAIAFWSATAPRVQP